MGENELDLYDQTMNKKIEATKKVFEVQHQHCAGMLELQEKKDQLDVARMRSITDARTYDHEKQLEIQAKKDEREHKYELQAIERQQKKDDQDNKRLEADIARMQKKNEVEHGKAVKDLEVKAEKNKIDREMRDGLMRELEIE